MSPCFAYRFKRDDETDAHYVERLAEELEAEFQRLGPETVIAFLAETGGRRDDRVRRRRSPAISSACGKSATGTARC